MAYEPLFNLKTIKMTEIEKKVIMHCISELSAIDTYKVWQDVNREMIEAKVTDAQSKDVLGVLSKSQASNVLNNCTSVVEWLKALIKE